MTFHHGEPIAATSASLLNRTVLLVCATIPDETRRKRLPYIGGPVASNHIEDQRNHGQAAATRITKEAYSPQSSETH